nr:NADH dehydrogenase subunit 2 [Pilophorus typicus]
MKTSSKILFLMMMLLSTIMTMCSNSWIGMWMGMEINLMSFIPLMFSSKNKSFSQSTMMYFLIQSLASMMFIVITLNNKYMFMLNNYSASMMLMSMMMKMGMPPFHFWLPEILNKMNWMMCFILLTWQKIIPIYVTSMIINLDNKFKMLICLSVIVGALGGVNQTSTRKLMTYSSISHLGWMIICASIHKKSWMIYMMLYSILMMLLTTMMHQYNIMFINQMNIFPSKNSEKMIMLSLILSIGGLPPFLGFLPKWITITYMIETKEFIMMFIMIISSLIMLMYYLRMMLSMSLISSHSQKWMNLSMSKKNILMKISLMNMMLPMTVLFLNFL